MKAGGVRWRAGVVRWKLRGSDELDRPSADLLLKIIDGFGTPAAPAKEPPRKEGE
jgi:hypothetical protein